MLIISSSLPVISSIVKLKCPREMLNKYTYNKDQKYKNKPKTKLSGLKTCPKGPDLTESIVPGSRSMRMARGTYLPPSDR